jgi:hypothetical protein
VIRRQRTVVLVLVLVCGVAGIAAAGAVAAVLLGGAGPAGPPDPGKNVGLGDEDAARRGRDISREAMRERAAVIAHRFWRKPITLDRLNELVAAICDHDRKAGALYVDRDGGLEAVPPGGEPRQLGKPYHVVEYGPGDGHPDRQRATAILRDTLDRAERESGAGR